MKTQNKPKSQKKVGFNIEEGILIHENKPVNEELKAANQRDSIPPEQVRIAESDRNSPTNKSSINHAKKVEKTALLLGKG